LNSVTGQYAKMNSFPLLRANQSFLDLLPSSPAQPVEENPEPGKRDQEPEGASPAKSKEGLSDRILIKT